MMRVLCAVLQKILRRQQKILDNQIITMEGIEHMSQVLDQIKGFAAKIDVATNVIAARIPGLIDKVSVRPLKKKDS